MSSIETAFGGVPASRLRLGALALIAAGLLLAPQGPLTFDVPTAPDQNLAFATGANSAAYRVAMTLTGIGIAFMVLGVFALYVRLAATAQERLAFVGLVMTVGLLVLFLPIMGFALYVVPAVGSLVDQGRPEMIDVMDQTFKEPSLPIAFLGGILWQVGGIVLGIAIFRSGVFWKLSGLLLIISALVGIPAFLDQKVLQLIGSFLTLLALVVVGIDLWRSTSDKSPVSAGP
jgi:hypothetical protein